MLIKYIKITKFIETYIKLVVRFIYVYTRMIIKINIFYFYSWLLRKRKTTPIRSGFSFVLRDKPNSVVNKHLSVLCVTTGIKRHFPL